MGNQARVPDGVNMFSTSTRNFDDRIGDGAKVYPRFRRTRRGDRQPGQAARRRPSILAVYKEKIEPKKDKIYKYLQFDEMDEYKKSA